MLNNHYYCVIMAGGIGSRFWPISRARQPKQFLDFASRGKSFLRFTYDRMKAVIPEENIIVVSLDRYKAQVKKQLPELPEKNLLLEPYNRNTAPCLTFAVYTILKRDPLAVVVTTPSDHVINKHDIFNQTLSDALEYAAGTDTMITIGVFPTRPDSNFGYIQMAAPLDGGSPVKVKTFTEKPDEELAQVFIDSGEFLWNTGIYAMRASTLRDELEKHAPEITRLWKGWKDNLDTERQKSFIESIYTDMPRISIEYAVMEKTDNAWLIQGNFKWADIGNWESLYEYLANHDANGNAYNNSGKGLVMECRDNIIYSDKSGKLLAIRGLDNYMVVDTENVLMICPRDEAKLKEFLSQLAMPDYEEFR